MKKITTVLAFLFGASVAGCATPPKPVTDEQFQHKEAMEDLDKNLKKEKKESPNER